MTAFALVAALLVAVACACVLVPLLRDEAPSSRAGVVTAVALALLLPVAAVVLYLALGNPEAVLRSAHDASPVTAQQSATGAGR